MDFAGGLEVLSRNDISEQQMREAANLAAEILPFGGGVDNGKHKRGGIQ